MKYGLELTEIDEFHKARWVSPQIAERLIERIGDMLEEDELQALLSQVVHEHDQTPHGPTEIGDTLTILHRAGEPMNASFVLKGRSFKKVTPGEVTHQIVKTRRLDDLDLIILGAVNDIHHEAVETLMELAKDREQHYLVLRAQDFARIFLAYRKICPNCGAPLQACENCGECDQPVEWTDLRYTVPEKVRYERLNWKDTSVKGLVRTSINLRVDEHYTKDGIYYLLEKAVSDARSEFGSEMVYVFAYESVTDHNNNNWICRAQWAKPNLESRFKCPSFEPEEVYESLFVNWNPSHAAVKEFVSENTGYSLPLIDEMNSIVEWIENRVRRQFPQDVEEGFHRVDLSVVNSLANSLTEEFRRLDDKWNNGPIAPNECKRYAESISVLISHVDGLLRVPSMEISTRRKQGQARWSLMQIDDVLERTRVYRMELG
jgi:hypothetical protein